MFKYLPIHLTFMNVNAVFSPVALVPQLSQKIGGSWRREEMSQVVALRHRKDKHPLLAQWGTTPPLESVSWSGCQVSGVERSAIRSLSLGPGSCSPAGEKGVETLREK